MIESEMCRFNPFRPMLAVCGVALLSGCGRRPQKPAAGQPEAAPRRVICGSPAVTEIVFALGCAGRVVGVSDYSTYPPPACRKERIGGWINPNRERLIALKPDIIITQGQHERMAVFAAEYGIRFHAVTLDTVADIYGAVESVAKVLHVPERGDALADRIREDIGSAGQRLAGAEARRILLLFSRAPGNLAGLSTMGPGTFLDEIVTLAGGTNVFSDIRGYTQVSKESILVRQPDVILEVNPEGLSQETIDRLRADWRGLGMLPAVKNNRIHYLTNDFLLVPGPRVGLTVEEFARAIHPELFVE